MPLPRPGAILFDLDDTLVNTSEAAARAWRDVAEAFADRLDLTADAVERGLHETGDAYWADAARTRADRLDADGSRRAVTRLALRRLGRGDHATADAMARHYGERRLDRLTLRDDALDTLAALRDRGVKLALVSNGDAKLQRDKVDRFGLAPWFRAVLIEGELGYGKPTPRVYERALDACGVPPTAAWCVGDHLDWEVTAPQRMGIAGVWFDHRGAGVPTGSDVAPDLIVTSLGELRRRATR